MSELSAEHLTARYPGQAASRAALADIDLTLQLGERLLLVGPNGAGKSTFIRVFAGLMRPTRGKALVGDLPARASRAHIGVVGHATFLYDELTAAENLRFYASLYEVKQPAARAMELLARVGLEHVADVQVGRLSRGQQQRVTIARALLHNPPVLLLDEPDTGLDVAAFALLEDLTTAADRAVVITTHDLANGLRLATRAAVLARGHLIHQQANVSPSDAAALSELIERSARE